jgi:hypothetical protein
MRAVGGYYGAGENATSMRSDELCCGASAMPLRMVKCLGDWCRRLPGCMHLLISTSTTSAIEPSFFSS